ncbi:MAG: hypothetical protein V3U71_04630 [Cocleimonas sp.]
MHTPHPLNYSLKSPSYQSKLTSKFGIYIGISCLVISLFLPALFSSTGTIDGFWVLATGWLGLLFSHFSWFANPLNAIAILSMDKRPVYAYFLSILAFVLATQTFWLREIPSDIYQGRIYIKELGLGFYIWYLGQFIILISIAIRMFRKGGRKQTTSLVDGLEN